MTAAPKPRRPVAANTRPPPAPSVTIPPPSTAPVTRGITICEPWAWLIASDFTNRGRCVKPVENRTWPTSFTGPVAIHASSSWRDALDEELLQDICDMHPEIAERMLAHSHLEGRSTDDRAGFNMPYHVGCIVGTVEVLACLPFDPSIDDFRDVCEAAGYAAWYDAHEIPPENFASGPYCFLLANPRQFTQPIPAKGALNFWHLKPPEVAAVAAALKKPLGEPVAYRAALHAAGKPAAMPNVGSFAKPRKPAAAKPATATAAK